MIIIESFVSFRKQLLTLSKQLINSSIMEFRRQSSCSNEMFDQKMKSINDNKQYRQALNLFDRCIRENTCLTKLLFDQALRASIELNDYQRAMEIERQIKLPWRNDQFIENRRICLHLKFGNIEKAIEIFNSTQRQTSYMYLSILSGLLKLGRANQAFDLVRQMGPQSNVYLFSTIFKICTQVNSQDGFNYGKDLFQNLSDKQKNDKVVLNSALSMFMKYGEVQLSERIFSQMETNQTTFAIMMNGYLINQMPEKAIEIFSRQTHPDRILYSIVFNACTQMSNESGYRIGQQIVGRLPQVYSRSKDILNSLSNMFIKYEDLENALLIFERLDRDVQSYGALMKLFNQRNEPRKTLELYQQMKHESIEPNEIIFVLVLDACSHIGNLSFCQSIVKEIPRVFKQNRWIQNSLIDMWGKCGSIEEAKSIFDQIDQPDPVTYASMINVYGLNGMGLEAIEIFNQLPLTIVNSWIHVSVLNACSHSGLVNQAQKIFDEIPSTNKTSQIYTTMVDVLSRSNNIDRALNLINDYELSNKPYLPMYMSILSASRNQRDSYLAEKVFSRMETLFSNHAEGLQSARILLANTYASNHQHNQAGNIRLKIDESKQQKKIGVSRTVVNNKIFEFHAHDRRHPRSKEIYEELDRLTNDLIVNGHQFDASWITRCLHPNETVQSALSGHSERIAIAFNLIQQPTPSLIQIVKNLRICGDCHAAIKLIAKIRQCQIIIRDANRIHHFSSDGTCSCNEHF